MDQCKQEWTNNASKSGQIKIVDINGKVIKIKQNKYNQARENISLNVWSQIEMLKSFFQVKYLNV